MVAITTAFTALHLVGNASADGLGRDIVLGYAVFVHKCFLQVIQLSFVLKECLRLNDDGILALYFGNGTGLADGRLYEHLHFAALRYGILEGYLNRGTADEIKTIIQDVAKLVLVYEKHYEANDDHCAGKNTVLNPVLHNTKRARLLCNTVKTDIRCAEVIIAVQDKTGNNQSAEHGYDNGEYVLWL